MKQLLLSLLMVVCGYVAIAQNTISGKIVDSETGEPLPGAYVQIKGTNTGTVTDLEGNYSISASPDDVLVISFVGFESQELTVGNRTVIDIQLASDIDQLSEVVVVGYGNQSKKEITSAAISIDSKDFNQGVINDPAQLLQGKVPGLSIYNRGGDPNSTPTIRIRGLSTIGANTEPLVVIDGVIGASLENVDPNDIENISVLKDGSAAAIYGTRGSNGVILVTTKGGKKGSPAKLTYNVQGAASTKQREVKVLSSDAFKSFGNNLGSSTNWLDEVTRTGYSQIHNLSLGGATDKTNYRFSLNYRGVDGILKKSGFEQFNARANVSSLVLDDKLKLNFNFSLTDRDSDFSFNEALRYATTYNPTAPIYASQATALPVSTTKYGGYFELDLFDNFNPVSIINQNINVGEKKTLNYNVSATYSITDQIDLTANLAQQQTSEFNGEYYRSTSYFRGINRNGLARRFAKDTDFILFETYGSYSNTFGSSLDFTFTGGYSFQQTNSSDFFIEAGNFLTDDLSFNALENSTEILSSNSQNVDIQSNASPNERVIAFFGRVNMTYDEAIFFNAALRREGSTRFGPGNQWGLFPSVGVGVDVLNYVDLGLFKALKFRAGYGVTGSQPLRPGLFTDGFEVTDNKLNSNLTRDANRNLKWEEKAEINLGLDFAGERFNGSLDVYNRTISDFILLVRQDAAISPRPQYQNAGQVSTNGLEFSFNYDIVKNTDFSYTSGVVLSTYKTILDKFIVNEEMRENSNLGAPGQNATRTIRVAVGGRNWSNLGACVLWTGDR